MSETPQEYRNRLLGNVKGQNPLKTQAATPARIVRLLRGVPASKLRKRPEPAKWSVHEIVVHMADTEIAYAFRMRMILGAPGSPLAAFDQDAWVTSGNYPKRDVRTAITQFAALRASNIALLKCIRPDQWKHAGMHSERGEESIEMLAAMMAGHDLNHLQQIERILKPRKNLNRR